MKDVTLGYDPEFFLETTDGELYPSVGLFGGTKTDKRALPDLGLGFAIEEDNVAVEMTAPPASTKKAFVDNMSQIVSFLETSLIPELTDVPSLVLSRKASGNFLKKYLDSKQAQSFGCSPELNAYTLDVFVANAVDAKNFRSCGGHIHLGWEGDKTQEDITRVVRSLDLFLGVPSLIIDKDSERRKLYGKAGSCRETPYGVEYRTLSNFWTFSPELCSWVYEQVMTALSPKNLELVKDPYSDLCFDVKAIINSNDQRGARELMNKFNIKLIEVTTV